MRVDTSLGISLWFRMLLVLGPVLGTSTNSSSIGSGRRIVNGVVANPEDFKYTAFLRTANGPHACGTVIGDRWILTAAHALLNDICLQLLIFPSNHQAGDTTTLAAIECYIHDKYTKAENAYDIGLIKSSDDLLADGKFLAIPLPDPGTQYAPGTSAVIAGWGYTIDMTVPDHLLTGHVEIESWESCNVDFAHSPPECGGNAECTPLNIPRRMVCARGKEPNPQNICAGDSGGPLTIDGVLAGIAAVGIFGDRCYAETAAMFTSVVDYLPWIYSFTEPDRDTSDYPVPPEFDKTIPA